MHVGHVLVTTTVNTALKKSVITEPARMPEQLEYDNDQSYKGSGYNTGSCVSAAAC